MNVDSEPSVATDDGDRRKATMERELQEDWDHVRACLGVEPDPDILAVAHNSFWLGVKTGVTVTTKAINGAFL
jgi:hypothetical protein